MSGAVFSTANRDIVWAPIWERVVATYGDCRKYAAYCLEMAEAAGSEESRVKYLELAQAWLSEAISQSPRSQTAPERSAKTH